MDSAPRRLGYDVRPVGRPYLLHHRQLRQSIQVDASDAAMVRVWRRLEAGQPLRIGVLGSSVAMSGGCQADHQPQLRCAQFDGVSVRKRFARGYGVVDDEMRGLLHNTDRPVRGFVMQVLDALNATWPHAEHRIFNAAVDAWTAKAIEPCILSNEQITGSDLLLLELGSQGWHGSQAAASERIVRRLLSRAGGPPPAMAMITTRQWCGRSVHGLRRKEKPTLLRTWEGIEDVFARLCKVYGLACLSMRDAIFHDVLAGRANFTVQDVAADCLHPEQSRYGYHYMADLIIHFLSRSWRRYRSRNTMTALAAIQEQVAPKLLLPPVLPANRGSAGRMVWRCYQLSTSPSDLDMGGMSGTSNSRVAGSNSGGMPLVHWQTVAATGKQNSREGGTDGLNCDVLRRCVLRAARSRSSASCLRGRVQWQYCSRALAPKVVNKPGIVSVLPGAVMRFVIDTTAPVTHAGGGGESAPSVGNQSGAMTSASLALTYLASYEHMGVGVVSCESGCSCQPKAIDALQMAQPATAGAPAGADSPLSRNVSIASVAELAVTSASRCVIRLENALRGLHMAPRGGKGRHDEGSNIVLNKWKLLQVRVGWDLRV